MGSHVFDKGPSFVYQMKGRGDMRRSNFWLSALILILVPVLCTSGQEEGTEGESSRKNREEAHTDNEEYRYAPEEISLAAGVSAPVLPADGELGALSDTRSLEGEKKRVLERGRGFLEALNDGKIERTFLDPESREALVLYLEPMAKAFPGEAKIRYAIPRIGGRSEKAGGLNSASLPFRIYTAKKSTAKGELTLVWSGKEWYIATADIPME